MSHILILNGPNLNLLGTREPEVYGTETLGDIQSLCEKEASEHGMKVDFRQTNHEGEMVSWVQEAIGKADGMIVNAGAYTHTSVALLDALRAFNGPIMEVHLSNIFQREEFRHHSFVAPVASGVICGLGSHGYLLAIQALARKLA